MNEQNSPQIESHPFDTRVFAALNHMRDACHQLAINKGWYDTEETPGAYMARCCANFHGEVSELWEAHRANTLNEPCDKADKMIAAGLQPLTCAEEEMADILIRVFDTAGRLNIDLEKAVLWKHAFNRTRPYRHGNKQA
jgi:NTP pyrophosphatase (non-canonical NTP hydrolase)